MRGNALPIMAGFTALLVVFAGCAIDGTRLYMVHARLQQSCDAAALAGRRAMTDTSTTNTTLDATATAAANAFFAANFRNGWYGTTSLSFTPSKTSTAQVAGTAKAVLGMTLMRVFGYATATVNVTCQASYNVTDTDVIFVLDTTGSMACLPSDSDATCTSYVGSAGTSAYTRPADGSASGNDSVAGYPGTTGYGVPEKSGSRISALRTAVLSFYDTMASAAANSGANVRYGFVTYTSTVNAGKAVMEMSPAYIVGGTGSPNTGWTYDSRTQTGTQSNTTCQLLIFNCTTTYTPVWTYQSLSQNLTSFVTGATIDDPSKTTSATSQWTGCLEERYTTPGVMTFNTSSLPPDLDPDLVPTSDIKTQWKPMWPDVFYARNGFTSTATATSTGDSQGNFPVSWSSNNDPNYGTAPVYQYGLVSCGKPVSRLQTMTRTQVSAYVNAPDFVPMGGTYHDTGMIWGTRLLSPSGIFGNDTAPPTGHSAPNRVIVFFTDGVMAPSTYIYGMYGNEYYDKRVSGGDFANLTNYHNARFLAECAAAKARNINVWTVALGMSTTSQLQACASSTSQALASSSGSTLATQFASIATQVAKLRLTQ